MGYIVQFADLQAQDVAVVRGEVPHDGLPDFLGPAFEEVMRVVTEQGLHAVGPPFGQYRPAEDRGWIVAAGFPVSGVVTTAGRVEPDRLPVGRAARTVHVGDYSDLVGAYEAATSFATDNGYEMSGDPWELYLDGPVVELPRTEVFVPCREVEPRRPEAG